MLSAHVFRHPYLVAAASDRRSVNRIIGAAISFAGGRAILSDLATLKGLVSVSQDDLTQNTKLGEALLIADAAVKNYCKRQFETAVYTEYPLLRNGAEALVVQEKPVLSYRLTGNIIQGSALITGLSSVSNLLVGMPVLLAISSNGSTTQPFPNGVTIQSIDTTNVQVTLTGNATQTLTGVTFIFGLAVWYDPQAFYGQGVGAGTDGPFGASGLLRAGLDYALQIDQPNGSSKCGKLIRLASVFGFLGMSGDWGPFGSAWSGIESRGTLSGFLRPLWPVWSPGSVKVVYAAGLGVGATPPDGQLPTNTTIPADLTGAVNGLAIWIFRNANSGLLQTQSSSYQGYSASMGQAVDWLKTEGDLGNVRHLLSRYRKLAI